MGFTFKGGNELKKRWIVGIPALLGIGYLIVNPTPIYALFGIGDVVFDPSSYAALGDIWNEDISNGAKLAETFNQTVKIVNNGLQIYNLAMAMAQRVQNKRIWEEAAFAAGNEITERHYNEQINFNAVMNGDYLDAANAWHQSTLYGGNAGYLGGLQASQSRRMANFATLQLLDQTSERCATILANYKSMQDTNQEAEDALASDAFDETDAKNSTVAALNILSGGAIHLHNQNKANGNLQACLAEQNTLGAKLQRDQLADEQNWYSDISNARASSPAQLDPENTANTIANYLEP